MVEEHEHAKKALKESESRYRELFENASDGMYVRDLKGNIIMANQAMSLLSGYTINELLEMNISRFLSEPSLMGTMERQRRRLENDRELKTQRYELVMIKKDGTERTIEVVTSLIAVGAYSPTIQTIARDITEQKRAHESIRNYAAKAIEAQEAERKRIAQDLHDETAQDLVSLGMDINSLIDFKGQNQKHVANRLEEFRNRTRDILKGVRSLSQALRPPMLEELGLVEALQWLTKGLAAQCGVKAQFDVDGTPRRLSPETEIAIFRIAQEGLNNIGKHAQATDITVKIKYHPEKVELKITDNGQGFELPDTFLNFAATSKLGLIGMHERAKLINGTLEVQSKLDEGTTLMLEVRQ